MPWTYREMALAATTAIVLVATPFLLPKTNINTPISVAMIGNSMIYYNDLPRLLEAISNGKITQNSCLHGDATLTSLLFTGNGMAYKFNTNHSKVATWKASKYNKTIYDYGACTVKQLLFGTDEELEEFVNNGYNDDDDDAYDDDSIITYVDDGSNPCMQDPMYNTYLQEQFSKKHNKPPQWDFVLLNDNTRAPPRFSSRMETLGTLQNVYVEWLSTMDSIPVFLHPHAYWSENRDMGGLESVPEFTALSYAGYKQYADLLEYQLQREVRIAPVGIAFLLIWEQDRDMWNKLIHSDDVHATPLGTLLESMVIYYTLYGHLPPKQYVLPLEGGIESLWDRARVMQQADHPANPMPTREQAIYVYNIAERVMKHGERPACFVDYQNGEAAYYDEELGYYL